MRCAALPCGFDSIRYSSSRHSRHGTCACAHVHVHGLNYHRLAGSIGGWLVHLGLIRLSRAQASRDWLLSTTRETTIYSGVGACSCLWGRGRTVLTVHADSCVVDTRIHHESCNVLHLRAPLVGGFDRPWVLYCTTLYYFSTMQQWTITIPPASRKV
jgi:hypothetical protein